MGMTELARLLVAAVGLIAVTACGSGDEDAASPATVVTTTIGGTSDPTDDPTDDPTAGPAPPFDHREPEWKLTGKANSSKFDSMFWPGKPKLFIDSIQQWLARLIPL